MRAEVERIWLLRGSRRAVYNNIVGSGPNSTIPHHPRSERTMRGGELILMDMAIWVLTCEIVLDLEKTAGY